MSRCMKITVVGAGYVGLANAVMLAARHDVTVLDIDPAKVQLICKGLSPIAENGISQAMQSEPLTLTATCAAPDALRAAELVVVAVPTNFDPVTGALDTRVVENVVAAAVQHNSEADVLIKSTVPVGFTDELRRAYGTQVLFSPEFLREGQALEDCRKPSRLIIGECSPRATRLAELFATDPNIPVLYMTSLEAEATKLFANSYLAMRVAFFNELDSYALSHGLSTPALLAGVGADQRIGSHYCNPSFGYGGYCLPKDVRQLQASFEGTPQALISAIAAANEMRKCFILQQVLARKPSKVGAYRALMKEDSSNFREAPQLAILHALVRMGVPVLVYEPLHTESSLEGLPATNSIDTLKTECDVILANRWNQELHDVGHKVISRDIAYGHNENH